MSSPTQINNKIIFMWWWKCFCGVRAPLKRSQDYWWICPLQSLWFACFLFALWWSLTDKIVFPLIPLHSNFFKIPICSDISKTLSRDIKLICRDNKAFPLHFKLTFVIDWILSVCPNLGNLLHSGFCFVLTHRQSPFSVSNLTSPNHL